MGNIWTSPAVKDRGKRFLTEEIMTRHFAGRDVGHIRGLHSTSAANMSRWGALDIDWHGECSADPQLNWEAARHWFGKARDLGFHPLLEDSNGCGGHHLWLLFCEPVPTPRVFAFLRWLTSDFADLGLPAQPETFPKQPSIVPGKYGNWLRLFGRHHTKDHWSRIWSGQQWLKGCQAIDFILTAQGVSPASIPAEALPVEKPYRYEPRRYYPVFDSDRLCRRISAYMARLPSGLDVGQQRHCFAFRFACYLLRDLQLSDAAALAWLLQWDGGNRAPLGEGELGKTIICAHRYGRTPYGSGR
jgi:hypothetical protein